MIIILVRPGCSPPALLLQKNASSWFYRGLETGPGVDQAGIQVMTGAQAAGILENIPGSCLFASLLALPLARLLISHLNA